MRTSLRCDAKRAAYNALASGCEACYIRDMQAVCAALGTCALTPTYPSPLGLSRYIHTRIATECAVRHMRTKSPVGTAISKQPLRPSDLDREMSRLNLHTTTNVTASSLRYQQAADKERRKVACSDRRQREIADTCDRTWWRSLVA